MWPVSLVGMPDSSISSSLRIRSLQASIICVLFQEEAALPWSSDTMSAGASSFGMSGVNAHALFTSPKALAYGTSEVDWQRERHWMAPSHHHMLSSARYNRQAGQCRSVPSIPNATIWSQTPTRNLLLLRHVLDDSLVDWHAGASWT